MNSGELSALERATRDSYLVQDTDAADHATLQAFRQWCRKHGRPLVVVENKGASLIFDTGSVWEHFQPQYPFLHEQPTFFTLDPTEELQIQVRHVINTSGFQGGAGIGGSYTWIAGLPIDRAEQTAQALLKIWEQAWAVHADRLTQQTAQNDPAPGA